MKTLLFTLMLAVTVTCQAAFKNPQTNAFPQAATVTGEEQILIGDETAGTNKNMRLKVGLGIATNATLLGTSGQHIRPGDHLRTFDTLSAHVPFRTLYLGDSVGMDVSYGEKRVKNQFMWQNGGLFQADSTYYYQVRSGSGTDLTTGLWPWLHYGLADGGSVQSASTISPASSVGFTSTVAQVYYWSGPGLGTLTVQTNTHGGSFATIRTIDASVGATISLVSTQIAISGGPHHIKVVSTGTNILWGTALWNNVTDGGFVDCILSAPGMTLEDFTSRSNSLATIIRGFAPDRIIVTVFDPVASMSNSLPALSAIVAANQSTADLIFFNPHPQMGVGSEADNRAVREVWKQYAASLKRTLVDGFELYGETNKAVALGWYADGSHLNSSTLRGQRFEGAQLAKMTGLGVEDFYAAGYSGLSAAVVVPSSNLLTNGENYGNLTHVDTTLGGSYTVKGLFDNNIIGWFYGFGSGVNAKPTFAFNSGNTYYRGTNYQGWYANDMGDGYQGESMVMHPTGGLNLHKGDSHAGDVPARGSMVVGGDFKVYGSLSVSNGLIVAGPFTADELRIGTMSVGALSFRTNQANDHLIDLSLPFALLSTNNNISIDGLVNVATGVSDTNVQVCIRQYLNTSGSTKTITLHGSMKCSDGNVLYNTNSGFLLTIRQNGGATNCFWNPVY